MDRLLSTREVAELIGNMSPRFVQREAASGRLRCQAIGAGARPTLRFLAADVELWRARYARERPPSEDPGGTDLTPRRPGREAP
jgi:hypothetical protein